MNSQAEPLSILQFTPFPRDEPGSLNRYVARLSAELAEAGHSVTIAAPGGGRSGVEQARQELARLAGDPEALFAPGEQPRLLTMGGSVKLPRGSGRPQAPASVDVGNRVEQLLGSGRFDIVHVHDPFLPSFSSTALRHSFSLNVGTFHETRERPFATQVARPLLEIFFGRLDGRTASSRASAERLGRFFPGAWELMPPGVDRVESDRPETGGPLRIACSAGEEPGALRLILRGLRRLPADLDWSATIHAENPGSLNLRVARETRERIRVVGPEQVSLAALCAASDIFIAASGGPLAAPDLVRQAIAAGAVPVVSDIEQYIEQVDEGRFGLLFPGGDPVTLSGQVVRLGRDRELLGRLRRAGTAADIPGWSDLAGRFEEQYRRLAARRRSYRSVPALRKRLESRPLIDIDLHMHTDHSPDCATPAAVLVETARDRGFGAIAVTDHNEISGALAAAEIAEGMDDFQVIVGEEVMTGGQGEVIGLFLKERIPRDMSMAETIAAIKEQGGIVYMPHPFDRLHSVPDYEHLLDVVEGIDLMEVFNPRVAISTFNEEAERFAHKYGILPAAGSDSHVAQGLGAVRVRVPRFEGRDEFLEAMSGAEITRRHKNLVYVQALKFLQTAGRPGPARRTVTAPQPARGGRRRARGRKRASGKS